MWPHWWKMRKLQVSVFVFSLKTKSLAGTSLSCTSASVLENHVIRMWGKYGHTGNQTPGLQNALHSVLPHYTTCPYNPLSCFQGYQSTGFTPFQHLGALGPLRAPLAHANCFLM